MSLLKLVPYKETDANFDPIEEARKAFAKTEFSTFALEAYVFGSATSAHFSAASDLDIFVIFESSEDMKRAYNSLGQQLYSEWPIDWVFKEKSVFDQRSEVGGVCYIVKREGVKIK